MKLPRWIPQTPKPWNPAWRETWEAMTPNGRRWSFVIDMIICALGTAFLVYAALAQGGPQ
jgi:hypothetical protein